MYQNSQKRSSSAARDGFFKILLEFFYLKSQSQILRWRKKGHRPERNVRSAKTDPYFLESLKSEWTCQR